MDFDIVLFDVPPCSILSIYLGIAFKNVKMMLLEISIKKLSQHRIWQACFCLVMPT